MMDTAFDSSKYVKNSLKIMVDIEDKSLIGYQLNNLANGIIVLSSVYGRFITDTIPILCHIDEYKSSAKDKSMKSNIIGAFLVSISNKMHEIEKYKNDVVFKNSLNTTYEFVDSNMAAINDIDDPYTYSVSLKYIRRYFDKLFNDMREMAIANKIANIKKYFPIIEEDIRSLYDEIFGVSRILASAFMDVNGVDAKMKDIDSFYKSNSINIKTFTDIVNCSYMSLELLQSVYNDIINYYTEVMKSANISDPSETYSECNGDFANLHKHIVDFIYNSDSESSDNVPFTDGSSINDDFIEDFDI